MTAPAKLRISDDLALPPEAVTQTFGILAKRGAGKSNSAAVLAEQMHAAGGQFVVVDPVGAWWGLRSSADGKGPGLGIPVLGGHHHDAPDAVNHPSHYTSHPSGIECIQITEHMGFCLGNAIKYLWRADLKGGVQDLEKAKWYIEREIARRRK